MDTAGIIVKIVGVVLFLFTARSIYRHIRRKITHRRVNKNAAREHSKVELALNAFMLYAWFTFMTAFSLGMIFNN